MLKPIPWLVHTKGYHTQTRSGPFCYPLPTGWIHDYFHFSVCVEMGWHLLSHNRWYLRFCLNPGDNREIGVLFVSLFLMNLNNNTEVLYGVFPLQQLPYPPDHLQPRLFPPWIIKCNRYGTQTCGWCWICVFVFKTFYLGLSSHQTHTLRVYWLLSLSLV